MIKIKIDNITFLFSYSTEIDEDFAPSGDAWITVPASVMKSFLKKVYSSERIGEKYDIDAIEEWEANGKKDPFSTNHSDLHIQLYKYIRERGKKTVIEYRGTQVTWLFHDWVHSKYHVDDYTWEVVADPDREEQAIYESMYLAQRYNLLHSFTIELLITFVHEFRDRWGTELKLTRMIDKLNQLLSYETRATYTAKS